MCVLNTIDDLAFWQRCKNYVFIVEDVLKALRVFDGREPAMGKAWITMHRLRRHVFQLREGPFFLPDHLAKVMEETFEERWNMFFTDVHYAGALLNPYIKDNIALREDGTALRALHWVVQKMKDAVGVRFDDVI